MSNIDICCNGLRTMIQDGTIRTFTAFGGNTGQTFVRGNNESIREYNQIRYCPFCGNRLNFQ